MSFKPDSNSEILIIYEVKMANPNGDPDDENRPRMDPKTKTNIVTDVRLKRFFRDYVIERYGEMKVWVSKVDGANVDQDLPYIFYYAVIKILVAKKSSIYDPSSSSDDGRREAVREFLKDFLRVLNDLGNRDPLEVLKSLLDFVLRYKSYSLPDSAPVPPVTL